MNSFNLISIFSHNMILQRDKQIRIWGESQENNLITVSINDIEVTVKAENGKWRAILPPMQANESCEMRVSSNNPNDYEIVIKNVAIGEVWVASGQSNMEFLLKFDAESKEVIPQANNPHIRFYDCPKTSYESNEYDDDFSEFGFWRLCDAQNAPYYSAVGFYFANKIYDAQKVPVGIIGCTWGGSSAAAWLDERYLAEDEELNVYLNEYEKAVKDINFEEYERKVVQGRLANKSSESKAFGEGWLSGALTNEQIIEMLSKLDFSAVAVMGPKHFNRPAGLYHNMIEKISGYSVRGVIWYQGEADDAKAAIYSKLFSAMIKCWRETWRDDLPFLFVQLAPYGSFLKDSDSILMSTGTLYPILRHQQEIVSKTVPKAYMASIMDVGMEFDIHPKKKRPVGERLALLARNKVYGENIISEAPEVENTVRKERSIDIVFKNVGEKFLLNCEKINGIQVFVDSEEIYGFKCEVNNNSMNIESEYFNDSNKIEVKFAWTAYVEVNLFSSAGLPVKPFEITI